MLSDKQKIIIEKERYEIEQIKSTLEDLLKTDFKDLSESDKKAVYKMITDKARNENGTPNFREYNLTKRGEMKMFIQYEYVEFEEFLKKKLQKEKNNKKP